MTVSTDELLESWAVFRDWLAAEAMREGLEGVVLRPLGRHPVAAAAIVRNEQTSDEYQYRKVGACLVGWSPQLVTLLEPYFRTEAQRAVSGSNANLEYFFAQSVVEDLVLSAARQARAPEARADALAFLRAFVTESISSKYWNSTHYALITLAYWDDGQAQTLLRSFAAWLGTKDRLSYQLEEETVRALQAGNTETLQSIEAHLSAKDAVADAGCEPETQTLLDNLLSAAASYSV